MRSIPTSRRGATSSSHTASVTFPRSGTRRTRASPVDHGRSDDSMRPSAEDPAGTYRSSSASRATSPCSTFADTPPNSDGVIAAKSSRSPLHVSKRLTLARDAANHRQSSSDRSRSLLRRATSSVRNPRSNSRSAASEPPRQPRIAPQAIRGDSCRPGRPRRCTNSPTEPARISSVDPERLADSRPPATNCRTRCREHPNTSAVSRTVSTGSSLTGTASHKHCRFTTFV